MRKVALFFLIGIVIFSILFGIGEGIAQPYSLNINGTGQGSGIVTSSPSGINCPDDCSEAYGAGKRVTLRAKPSSDSYFVGWSGEGCSGTRICSVTMDSDKNITATFEKKTPKLSVSPNQLDFGQVEVGKKAEQKLILSNIGTADLNATIGVTGDYFSIKGKSIVTIKPGRSYKLGVIFQPKPDYPGIEVDLGSDGPFLTEESQPSSYRATVTIDFENDGMDISVEGTAFIDPDDYIYNFVPDFTFYFHYSDEDSDQVNKIKVEGIVIMELHGTQQTGGRKESFYAGEGLVTVGVDQGIYYTSSTTTMKGSGVLTAQIAARRTNSLMIIDVVKIEGKIPVEICSIDNYGSKCLSGEGVDFPYRYIYENLGDDGLNCPICNGCEAIESGECYEDPQLELCNKFRLYIL